MKIPIPLSPINSELVLHIKLVSLAVLPTIETLLTLLNIAALWIYIWGLVIMMEQLVTFILARNSIDLHLNLFAEFKVLFDRQRLSSFPFWLTKTSPLGQLNASIKEKQTEKYSEIMPSWGTMIYTWKSFSEQRVWMWLLLFTYKQALVLFIHNENVQREVVYISNLVFVS